MPHDRARALWGLGSALIIDGLLGAPENFTVRDQAVRVKLGEKEITFKLNEQGIGKEPRAQAAAMPCGIGRVGH